MAKFKDLGLFMHASTATEGIVNISKPKKRRDIYMCFCLRTVHVPIEDHQTSNRSCFVN